MKASTPYRNAIIIAVLLMVSLSLKAFNTIETTQEAENSYTYSGPGTPIIMDRGMASNKETLWVNEVGGEAGWEITVPATGDYSLVVRYSNDDTGVLDDISVRVNGVLAGSFESEDTGNGGAGWNVFVDSPIIPLGQLDAGTATISLRLDTHDGHGIEFDILTLTGTNIQSPPAPQPISPPNNATDITANTLLEWNNVPGINTYHIQISDNLGFNPLVIDMDNLTGQNFQTSGLEEGTTYYWRIQASNICESSLWSATWQFKTECLVMANISTNGPTALCDGESVELTASGGNTFLWSSGATTSSITVEATDNYSVTVSNSPNCTASTTETVMVEPVVQPAVSITVGNQLICGGTSTNFTATTINEGNQPNFQWQINGLDVGTDTSVFTTNTLNNGDTVQCRLLSSENCTTANPVFSNAIVVSKNQAYYHPFQNFDDDVDRIKTFTNFFGGNNGIIFDTAVSQTPFISLSFDAATTRTGYGRSLKIDYENMFAFNIYTESFERKWFDNNTWLDLYDLFPDFVNPAFQNRQIDSIVFYGKLSASLPLTLEVKLEDALGGSATLRRVVQPSAQWQRFAFALTDFIGNFNPGRAKFIGLNFDKLLGQNNNASGTFHLDDMYLVESCFEKPTFVNGREMMAYLNEVGFRHFWMAVEPQSKFALDRHVWDDLISVDAIGFSLATYVVAHKNGWVDSALAESRVEHILTYLLDNCDHATDTFMVKNDTLGFASVHGIWAHFLDHKTLSRKDGRTEYSIFSTALLLGGVLTAAEYFDANPTIVANADALYRMTDWNFLLRPDGLMNYDWKPETSYSPYYTDWFSEELDLAFLLGISSPDPMHQLPSNPYFHSGYNRPKCLDGDYIYSAPGANFTYYFLQMYARFGEQTQRFQNSKNALLDDLVFCQNEYDSLGYNPLIFGTTACEGPDSAGIKSINGTDTTFISNYHAYGYCCKFDQHNTGNGTVAVYGSGSAAPFLPQEVEDLWRYYYEDLDEQFWENYGYRFWSPIFGMPDAFHLNPDHATDSLVNVLGFRGPWLSVPRFGIDVGPMLMNMDSYLSESAGEPSLRDYFSSHPLIAPNLPQFENLDATDELKATMGVALVSDSIACEGDSLMFIATHLHGGDTPIFEWFLDGALEQSGPNAAFSINASVGSHFVFCKMISNEHCIEGQMAMSDTLTVEVSPALQVGVSLWTDNDEICEGGSVTLTAHVTNGGNAPVYQWFVNGMDVFVNDSVLVLNDLNSTVDVTCSVLSSAPCVLGNPAMSTVVVTINDLPTISFKPFNSSCVTDSAFVLDIADPPGGDYSGDGVMGNIFDPAVAGAGETVITYTYTNPVTGCTNVASTILQVLGASTPGVQISPLDTAVCKDEYLVFEANPINGGMTPIFEWFINGTPTGVTAPVFEMNALDPGIVSITCQMTSSEKCVDKDIVLSMPTLVTVFSLPEVSAANSGPACEGDPLTLTASGGYTYHWEGPNGFIAVGDTVFVDQIMMADMGTYSVVATNVEGCSDTATTVAMVNASPTLDSIESNSPICDGDTLHLSADSNEEIMWISPSGEGFNEPDIFIPDASDLDTGVWVVSATSLEGCEVVGEVEVIVHELPVVSLLSMCFPDTVLITDSLPYSLEGCGDPPGGEFWVDGVMLDPPEISSLGLHLITYFYTDTNNCTGTAVDSVELDSVVSMIDFNMLEASLVIFPNPSNGVFTIKTTGLNGTWNIRLVNSLGQIAWQTDWDFSRYKDAKVELAQLPKGVYYISFNGEGKVFGKKIIID